MCIRDSISVPNFVKTGQSVAKILRSFDFSRWQQLPSWIFEIVNFYLLPVSAGPRHIIVPNFVKIARSIAEILQFFEFFEMTAGAILHFWNREVLLAVVFQKAETHQRAKFCQNWSFRYGYIAIFRIFNMATAAILDFGNREILLVTTVQRLETHQLAKFCQNRSIDCEDIKIFRFFKMAASAILYILYFRNREFLFAVNICRARGINVTNFVIIGRSVAEILHFFECSRWPLPPSWIFEIAKFYSLLGSWVARRISVPSFVKTSQSVAKILRFYDFSRRRQLPSWIFEIVNFY